MYVEILVQIQFKGMYHFNIRKKDTNEKKNNSFLDIFYFELGKSFM